MDIWRIPVSADAKLATAERITNHNARVAYLAWLDSRTLIYSATAEDSASQGLYAIDVEHRIPHVVSSGINEQYLSVSVSRTDPRRLITTIANPTVSLWTVPVSDGIQTEAAAGRLPAPNARARGARFASDGLFFLSSKSGSDGLWRLEKGAARELWKGSDGGVVAPPSISPDGSMICFSYRKQGRAGLYLMGANGTNVKALTESLDVRGAASWSPDGKWIAVAGDEGGGPRLYKIPVGGGQPERLSDVISFHPLWSPDGRFILYSEQIGGGFFQVKAITPDKKPFPMLDSIGVSYTTSDPYRFMPHQNVLVYLKEQETVHQNFYSVDLETGRERQLTDLQPGFFVDSFDISPDGKQIIFDRLRNNSDIVLMELAR
jgi:WD40 repeat protein